MNDIFRITTKDNKVIRLGERQWHHIKQRHPEMVNRLADIEDAIGNYSSGIQRSDSITKFYKFIKKENRYIVAVVKILNGEGFVITAYKTKRM